MSRQVRRTMAALGVGVVAQRVCQLVALMLVARALGPEVVGRYALGIAAGALLTVLSGAGIRALVAREVVADPDGAGGWIRAAIRMRLLLGAALYLPYTGLVALWSQEPLFWWLAGAAVFPHALDLKGLADSAARTGFEVALETASGVLHLLAVALLLGSTASSPPLSGLMLAYLGSRVLYALGTLLALRGFATTGTVPPLRRLLGRVGLVSLTQTAHGLLQSGDVWLVFLVAGPHAAGLYAVAARIVTAAALPAVQLTRLLQPHANHAARAGDSAQTLQVGLRGTCYVVLPIVAGGCVVAEPLCSLFGAEFTAAGLALRGLLLGMTALQLGWQASQALFARRALGAYIAPLWLGVVTQVGGIALLAPALGAAGGGLAAAMAHALYATVALAALRRQLPLSLWEAARPALPVTALVTVAAWGAGLGEPHLFLQLGAGAAAFGAGLWLVELRGRWARLGDGLTRASGFGSTPDGAAPRLKDRS